jgi:hypothetical protein
MNLKEIRERLEKNQVSIDEFEAEYYNSEKHAQHVYLRNHILGLLTLNKDVYSDGKINKLLTCSAAKLEKLLEGETKLPSKEEAIYVYGTSLKNNDLQNIKNFYEFYPMLNLCFDEKFLVLSNYLLETDYINDELKENIKSLTKKVIELSNEIIPIEGINDVNVGKKEYTKLCKFTLKKIKRKEKELEKEEKVKRLK